MATSVVQYAKIIRDAHYDIARKLGTDPALADKTTRALLLATFAIIGTLIKVLVDTGGKPTDKILLTAINTVRTDAYDPGQEPVYPVDWDTAPVTGLPGGVVINVNPGSVQ
jgi:hypothetical protein